MKKVIYRVYADSLAMPRADSGLLLETTYPEQLRVLLGKRGVEATILNRARGGTTLTSLSELFLADSSYFGAVTRGVVVIQCGIVDCAPRPIPMWARRSLSRLPGHARAPIVGILHRNRARILNSGFRFRFTNPREFRKRFEQFITQANKQCDHVYVIGIAPTIAGTDGHSPGLSESIDLYNSFMKKAIGAQGNSNVTLLDVCDAIEKSGRPTSDFVSPTDGHHLTAEGHLLYATLISRAETQRLARFNVGEAERGS